MRRRGSSKGRYEVIGPHGVDMGKLAYLDDEGRLWLCLPLTPSQNYVKGRHWSYMLSWENSAYLIALAQARTVLGSYRRPWTDRAELSIVRCSEGRVMADTMNVYGGAKEAIDLLLLPTAKVPGRIGLLTDDSPKHLTMGKIEDRPLGHWDGWKGPATWIGLKPLEDL